MEQGLELYQIVDDAPFPPTSMAWREPDGLLAWDGDLSPARLIAAYTHGIFPWFNPDQPILWWSPSKRMVLNFANLHISHSMRKTLKKIQRQTYQDRQTESVRTNEEAFLSDPKDSAFNPTSFFNQNSAFNPDPSLTTDSTVNPTYPKFKTIPSLSIQEPSNLNLIPEKNIR